MLSWRRKGQWLMWLLLFAAAGATASDHKKDSDVGYLAPQSLSLDQAADKVRRTYGGRVLSITPVDRAGTDGFEVRVLVESGRVKTVFVDERGRLSGK